MSKLGKPCLARLYFQTTSRMLLVVASLGLILLPNPLVSASESPNTLFITSLTPLCFLHPSLV